MRRLKSKLLLCATMAICMTSCDSCGGDGEDGDLCSHAKVGPESFKTYMEKLSDPQIIDYRSEEDFAKGHIPGAVNIPVTIKDLDGEHGNCEYTKKAMAVFDTNEPLLVYGGDVGFGINGQAVPGHLACKFGEDNVTLLVGGFKAWEEKGYTTEK